MAHSSSSPSPPPHGDAVSALSPAAMRLRRLHSSATPEGISAVIVKLTDESVAAIARARVKRLPIRMHITGEGGRLEIAGDNPCAFAFSLQQLTAGAAAPADAVQSNRSGGYRSVATLTSKIQIQATDKTFAETREKTQALVDEAKKKKAKELQQKRRSGDHRSSSTLKRPVQPSPIARASGSQLPRVSPPSAKMSMPNNGLTHNGQLLSSSSGSSSTGNAIAKPQPPRAPPPTMTPSARAELMKKPLRKRVLHLVVTGRFRSGEEVLARLTKDGLPEAVKANEVQAIVNEVSETGKDDSGTSTRLHLRPVFHNEVDTKWPWFTTEDQARLRRVLMPVTASGSGSAVVAPSRRSTIAPPSARTHANSVSPDAPPPMPPSTASAGKKVSPPVQLPPSSNSPSALLTKRKPEPLNNSASIGSSEKRPRQQSLSPPEDPTNNNSQTSRTGGPSSQEAPVRPSSVASNSSKSTNAMLTPGSSPSLVRGKDVINMGASLQIDAPKPSRDWEGVYDELRTADEAERYYNTFQGDYPVYIKCFKTLSTVANEFKELERQLKDAQRHAKEHEKVERSIQTKFAHYQNDAEFLATRQRHSDLRAKLSVLKHRLDEWDKHGPAKTNPGGARGRAGNDAARALRVSQPVDHNIFVM